VTAAAGAPGSPPILWVASEAVPWASTGGLADVVGALPSVLRDRGWDVRLCLPYYPSAAANGPSRPIGTLALPAATGAYGVMLREAIHPPWGVPTYFVDCPALFDRDGLYGEGGAGFGDNPLRFGLFQLAARALAERLEPAPAIVHGHDWHAALLPALLQLDGERPERLADTRTVLTIHNLQFQGESDRWLLDTLGLPPQLWHPRWAEHFGRLNPLKAGILSADRVTTVSPTYASEIRSAERGLGLDGPLRERAGDFVGILNGIDSRSWNPETDPALAARFSADSPWGRLSCRAALRAELGFVPDPSQPGEGGARTPIIGFVGRLTTDKGVDLLDAAIPELIALGACVVTLGNGDLALERALREREREFPGRFRALVPFDRPTAHRLFAGADVVVVPSRAEPCGLVQLYALRYGAVPVVHATGGLRDTIRDGETGFFFHEPSAPALVGGVRRALEVFAHEARWAQLQDSCMRQNWSWDQSAAGYEALYRDLLDQPPRRRPPPQADEKGPSRAVWGPPLPARLGSETFRLLVQGPRSLFAYWESATPGPLEIFIEERPTGIVYRAEVGRSSAGEVWLEVEPERAYRALLRRPEGRVVATSNAVLTPREAPTSPGDEVPPWLEAALRFGLFSESAGETTWRELFRDPPRLVDPPSRGGRGGTGGGVSSGFPYFHLGTMPR
jgi:starch synthase